MGIIPALDAAETIGAVVAGTRRHLARVIVVDDGSSDDTAARAGAAGAEVIRHPVNRGKGAALQSAFERLLAERTAIGPGGATFEGAVTLDADGQHDPDDIPRLVDLFRRERPAIIVGSRASYFEAMRGARRAMNLFSCASLRVFAGIDLPDSQSGFRLYDARFLEKVRLLGTRYEAEMEALMRAAGRGLAVISMPIQLRVVDGRPTSHYRALADTLRIVGTVLRLWLRRRLGRRE
ncbi:MAG TPA: glycosyltransferase family 2 protein [Candidatus Polarisedimenticolia bacterium]|nr:glycosyltransferase family 2 protein [Candidatus Polarisedimenticolia bacterium]